ncbi:ATP-binding protein [Streptomyces sp. YJ-C3]
MTLWHSGGTLSGVPDNPAEAREAVDLLIEEPGEACPVALRGDIMLAVSELVSNAEQHTPGIRCFTAAVHGGTLGVTVDYAPGGRGDFHMSSRAGYGWSIVTAVAASVTATQPLTGGKRVRVLLRLH